jgi:hypothetical protein
MKRRYVGLIIGLLYAVFLGFLLLMLTGGGHGNFGPLIFFIVTSIFGLFYPVIGFVVADVRSRLSRSTFVAVFLIHLFLVFVFFSNGLGESNASPRDNLTFSEHPFYYLIVLILLSAPQAILIVMFISSFLREREIRLE